MVKHGINAELCSGLGSWMHSKLRLWNINCMCKKHKLNTAKWFSIEEV